MRFRCYYVTPKYAFFSMDSLWKWLNFSENAYLANLILKSANRFYGLFRGSIKCLKGGVLLRSYLSLKGLLAYCLHSRCFDMHAVFYNTLHCHSPCLLLHCVLLRGLITINGRDPALWQMPSSLHLSSSIPDPLPSFKYSTVTG